jgi:hypothetical protein
MTCSNCHSQKQVITFFSLDRKTDLVFGMKDFIFSHEPSAWRFDVKEELNGHKQVVDFTDDTTGSPHKVARSHVSMYVNEVGHDNRLVENVCPLDTPRSVSYYVFIDEPMKKGDKVELLVNYGEHYEEMRERRGYGKSNTLGVKSDDHDYSRVRRNLRDRMQIEDSISSCFEEDIHGALNFFKTRVWDGLSASTSRSTPIANDLDTFRRQSIARRRLHWLSQKFRARLLQLCGDGSSYEQLSNTCPKTSCSDSIFYVGMFVFINNWMPKGGETMHKVDVPLGQLNSFLISIRLSFPFSSLKRSTPSLLRHCLHFVYVKRQIQ